MKCSKCSKEATFGSPEPLCNEHWVDWWVALETNTKKRREQKKEALKQIRATSKANK